jgi:hypothetical protein
MRSIAPSSPDANAPHLHDGRLSKTRPNYRVVRTSSRQQDVDVLDDDAQVNRIAIAFSGLILQHWLPRLLDP